MRPKAIVQFEALLLSAALIDLINNLIAAPDMAARLAARHVAGSGLISLASAVIPSAIALLFWYLIVRRRSVAAKQVMTVLVGLGVLVAIIGIARGSMPLHSPVFIVVTLTELLKVAAVTRLFTAQARLWLGEGNMS